MLEQTTTNFRKSGIKKNVETLYADAGYFRENLDIKNIEKKGPKLLLCTKNTYKFKKEIKKKIDLEDKISEKRLNRNLMDRDY